MVTVSRQHVLRVLAYSLVGGLSFGGRGVCNPAKNISADPLFSLTSNAVGCHGLPRCPILFASALIRSLSSGLIFWGVFGSGFVSISIYNACGHVCLGFVSEDEVDCGHNLLHDFEDFHPKVSVAKLHVVEPAVDRHHPPSAGVPDAGVPADKLLAAPPLGVLQLPQILHQGLDLCVSRRLGNGDLEHVRQLHASGQLHDDYLTLVKELAPWFELKEEVVEEEALEDEDAQIQKEDNACMDRIGSFLAIVLSVALVALYVNPNYLVQHLKI